MRAEEASFDCRKPVLSPTSDWHPGKLQHLLCLFLFHQCQALHPTYSNNLKWPQDRKTPVQALHLVVMMFENSSTGSSSHPLRALAANQCHQLRIYGKVQLPRLFVPRVPTSMSDLSKLTHMLGSRCPHMSSGYHWRPQTSCGLHLRTTCLCTTAT